MDCTTRNLPQLSTFHPFPRLPIELQTLIWRHTYPHPLCTPLCGINTHHRRHLLGMRRPWSCYLDAPCKIPDSPHFNYVSKCDKRGFLMVVGGTRLPPLLMACWLSRKVVLEGMRERWQGRWEDWKPYSEGMDETLKETRQRKVGGEWDCYSARAARLATFAVGVWLWEMGCEVRFSKKIVVQSGGGSEGMVGKRKGDDEMLRP